MKSNKTSTTSRLGIFFLVVVVVAGVGMLWWRDAIAQPNASDPTPNIFVVKQGESVRSIATRLFQQGLIRDKIAFYVLVRVLGLERDLQAGDFRLNRSMDTRMIAEELTHGTLDVWLTTLEGWRNEEIAMKIAKEMDIPETEFLKYAREGSMFPDTYLVPKDASASTVAQMFLDTFDAKVTPQMRQDARTTGLTFEEIITMASIVEREGRTAEDRPVIAGILLKRLRSDWPLQTDATIQYALGYQPVQKTWWKREITDQDKKIRSAYNTYANKGLPPGPIANPGLASIQAVIYSADSDYWFYLHDPQAIVHYGRTIEEHEANIAKYLR